MDWVARLDEIFPPRVGPAGNFPPIVANTPDWYRVRRGRLTASKRAEIIGEYKPVQICAMMDELNYELSDEWKRKEITNDAMEWGRKHERAALTNLELALGLMDELVEPGFMFHPQRAYVGGTPDALIRYPNKLVAVQVKCPYNPQNHLKVRYEQCIKVTYWHQVQWEAWISGADEILFVSYDPRQPVVNQLVMLPIPVHIGMRNQYARNCDAFKKLFEGEQRPATVKSAGLASYDSL